MSLNKNLRNKKPKSSSIEFRTYKEGDEEGLAVVFNNAFQSLGGGFLRTAKAIKWRYISRPDFSPNEIRIAVEKQSNKIVGSIYCTIEEQDLGKEIGRVKIGAINDVATLPEYRGYGISKTLLKQAISFMEEENCIFSVLSADPNGFPRKKLYIPFGWKDCVEMKTNIIFTGARTFIQALPGLSLLAPGLQIYTFINKLQEFTIKKWSRKYNIDLELYQPLPCKSKYIENYNYAIKRARELSNIFYSKVAIGAIHLSKKEWYHFRSKVPWRFQKPSIVILRDKQNLEEIGIATFTISWIYSTKMGIKIPIAFIKEFIIDAQPKKEVLIEPNNQRQLYRLLISGLIKLAKERNAAAIVLTENVAAEEIHYSFKYFGALSFKAGIYMVKKIKKKIEEKGDLQFPCFTREKNKEVVREKVKDKVKDNYNNEDKNYKKKQDYRWIRVSPGDYAGAP